MTKAKKAPEAAEGSAIPTPKKLKTSKKPKENVNENQIETKPQAKGERINPLKGTAKTDYVFKTDEEMEQGKLMNATILEGLIKVAEMERAAGDNFKANSFYKAHGMIVTYAQKINSGKEAAKLLKGVGKSIATMIDDLLTTGTTTKLEDKKKGLEDVDTVSLLETVIGINHQFAKSLVNDHSIKSIKDLLELKYCDDLKATHSVTEIANIETIIRAEFPEFIFTIVGAYRRNQPADQIHVVIKSTADTDIHSMVQKLKDIKLILDDLKQSTSTHYEGACKIDTDKCTLIILDIVSSISYIPTVFNLTGNEEFVKVAVQSASNVDLSLTPVSLQDSNGGNMFINVDLVELFDEKELFTKIELDWMEPCDRSW